jgi:hypothetical protein
MKIAGEPASALEDARRLICPLDPVEFWDRCLSREFAAWPLLRCRYPSPALSERSADVAEHSVNGGGDMPYPANARQGNQCHQLRVLDQILAFLAFQALELHEQLQKCVVHW